MGNDLPEGAGGEESPMGRTPGSNLQPNGTSNGDTRAAGDARLRAVMEVTAALLAGRELDDILCLIAAHARSLVGSDLATIAVPVDDFVLEIRVAVGHRADRLRGLTFPREHSISGTVIESGRAELLDDAAADARAHQPIIAVGGFGPALFSPLVVRGEAFGTLLVANRRGGWTFGEREFDLVETFAAQASVVLEYQRAQRELERLLALEDRERTGRDLHDTVIQRLFATGLSLRALLEQSKEPEVALRLERVVEQLDATIRDIRGTIFSAEVIG